MVAEEEKPLEEGKQSIRKRMMKSVAEEEEERKQSEEKTENVKSNNGRRRRRQRQLEKRRIYIWRRISLSSSSIKQNIIISNENKLCQAEKKNGEARRQRCLARRAYIAWHRNA